MRLVSTAGGFRVLAWEFERLVPYKREIVVTRQINKVVAPDEWTRAVRAVAAAEFWRMGPASDERGNDGAEWVLEGRRGGAYKVVNRWSADGAFREAGLAIVRASGLAVSEDRIY